MVTLGQKLIVETKGALVGLHCHDQAPMGNATLAAPQQCIEGEVSAIAIDTDAYMAMGPNQCAGIHVSVYDGCPAGELRGPGVCLPQLCSLSRRNTVPCRFKCV
jgi:hypothetical protein